MLRFLFARVRGVAALALDRDMFNMEAIVQLFFHLAEKRVVDHAVRFTKCAVSAVSVVLRGQM